MLLSLATLLIDPIVLQYDLLIVLFFSADIAFTKAAIILPLYFAILSGSWSTFKYKIKNLIKLEVKQVNSKKRIN